jgi:hypothetical protein
MKCIQILVGKPLEKKPLGRSGGDGKITLEQILGTDIIRI